MSMYVNQNKTILFFNSINFHFNSKKDDSIEKTLFFFLHISYVHTFIFSY